MKSYIPSIILGATLAIGDPASVSAQSRSKIPSQTLKKVGDIFRGSASNSTRVIYTLGATLSVAQLAMLDEKSLDPMAHQYFLSEKSKASEAGKLLNPENNQLAYRVQQVTRSILKSIKQNPKYQERYQEIKTDITNGDGWKVITLDNPSLNAYCLPGARMVVYSGLAERLTDDELAMVISHEIMHAMQGHSFHRVKDSLERKALIYGAGAVSGARAIPMTMAVLGEAFVTQTIFSKQDEKESDIMGLHIAHDAGYDPYAAVSLWKKMNQLQKGGQIPEILSSHPSHITREEYLRNEIQKLGK